MPHGLGCPSRGFIVMAGGARVGNFVLVGHLRRNEAEGVRVHESVRRTFGFDLRHVTSDALASWRIFFVMGVFFERGCARAIWRKRAVAI